MFRSNQSTNARGGERETSDLRQADRRALCLFRVLIEQGAPRVEVKHVSLVQCREELFWMMAAVIDDGTQLAKRRVVQGAGYVSLTVGAEDSRSSHRCLATNHARC